VKRIHLLPVGLLLVGALAGCHQGQNANTTIQGETGNGAGAEVGALQVAAARVVAGQQDGTAALTATVLNAGAEADALEGAAIAGSAAVLLPDPIELPPGARVAIGTTRDQRVQFSGLQARAGQFVDLTLQFARGGDVEVQVLIVPPVGFYEPYAPDADSTAPAPAEAPAPAAP
jgi:hypothetical protein